MSNFTRVIAGIIIFLFLWFVVGWGANLHIPA